MAHLVIKTANLAIADGKKNVCSVRDILPTVSAENAEQFVGAVETLYNNGECSAQIRVVYDLDRS